MGQSFHIELQRDDLARDLRHILEGFDFQLAVDASKILTRQYIATQTKVHIKTGSLKSSGKIFATNDKFTFEGEIAYGGASAGVHDPVEYAAAELARGSSHFFMGATEDNIVEHEYSRALLAWLGRATG